MPWFRLDWLINWFNDQCFEESIDEWIDGYILNGHSGQRIKLTHLKCFFKSEKA